MSEDPGETDPGIRDLDVSGAIDAGDPGEERSAPKSGKGGDPNLAYYFHDLAAHPVMSHAEEVSTTRHIQELETIEWSEVLCYPAVTGYLLNILRDLLGRLMPSDSRRLRLMATRFSTEGPTRISRARWEAFRALGRRVGEWLRDLDCDRRMLDACIEHVASAPAANGSCPPFLRRIRHTPRYQRYLEDLAAAKRRTDEEKRRFILANLRLVVSVARRYHRGRMSLADMIQEGNIGLIKAVDRFDVRKGYRFSTYASWWIRHAINRSLADKGRAIRIPVHMLDMHQRIQRAFTAHAAKCGSDPDVRDVAEQVGVDEEKIRSVRAQSIDAPVSLDRPISDDEGRRFVDLLASEDSNRAFDDICTSDWNSEVERLLSRMPAIEADIIRSRFGLGDQDELTLREIGDRYQLSRERIRQLQEQALGRMRNQIFAGFD